MTADLGLSIFEPSIQETFFFAFGLCQAAGQGTEEVGCEYRSSSRGLPSLQLLRAWYLLSTERVVR